MKPVPLQWIGEKQLEVIIDFPAGRVVCSLFRFQQFLFRRKE